jgi:hypothetical protein
MIRTLEWSVLYAALMIVAAAAQTTSADNKEEDRPVFMWLMQVHTPRGSMPLVQTMVAILLSMIPNLGPCDLVFSNASSILGERLRPKHTF